MIIILFEKQKEKQYCDQSIDIVYNVVTNPRLIIGLVWTSNTHYLHNVNAKKEQIPQAPKTKRFT